MNFFNFLRSSFGFYCGGTGGCGVLARWSVMANPVIGPSGTVRPWWGHSGVGRPQSSGEIVCRRKTEGMGVAGPDAGLSELQCAVTVASRVP